MRLSGTPAFMGHDAQPVRELAQQVAAIGRNLNQIARAMNAEAGEGRVRELELAELRGLIGEVLAFEERVRALRDRQLGYWRGRDG